MLDQIDQIQTVVTRLDEAYAIAALILSHFERSKPSEAEIQSAYTLTGSLIGLVSDTIKRQRNSLNDTIEALYIFYTDHEAVA